MDNHGYISGIRTKHISAVSASGVSCCISSSSCSIAACWSDASWEELFLSGRLLHWSIPLSLQLPLNGGRLGERPGPSELERGIRCQTISPAGVGDELRFHALWMPKRVNMSGPCLVSLGCNWSAQIGTVSIPLVTRQIVANREFIESVRTASCSVPLRFSRFCLRHPLQKVQNGPGTLLSNLAQDDTD